MQLKLACADFAFPLLEHDRVLDLIAMLGFEGVDVGLFEGRSHLWPSRVFKNDWEHCNEVDNLSETILFRDFFRSQNGRR